MADITIPQLNAATSVSGTDVMVISQAGVTKKVEVDKLLSGVRSDLNEIEINKLDESSLSSSLDLDSENNAATSRAVKLLNDKVEQVKDGGLEDGSIELPKLSPTLASYIGSGGAVTNQADDEDLENAIINDVQVIREKTIKAYTPETYSGMGRVILRKNTVGEVNTLTQSMLNQPNTIYEIRYDFDLNGQEITIPENCIFKFEGGRLNNGTVIFNNTLIKGNAKFNCNIKGFINNDLFNVNWIDKEDLGERVNFVQENFKNLIVPYGKYSLNTPIKIESAWHSKIIINGLINFTGNLANNEAAIEISKSHNTQVHINYLYIDKNVVDYTKNRTINKIGFKISSCNNCFFNINHIEYFNENIRFSDILALGCSYNTIYPKLVSGGNINIRFYQHDYNGNISWVNANHIYGGRFAKRGSSFGEYETYDIVMAGPKFEENKGYIYPYQEQDSYDVIEDISIENCSFEYNNTVFYIRNGYYGHSITNCRFEGSKKLFEVDYSLTGLTITGGLGVEKPYFNSDFSKCVGFGLDYLLTKKTTIDIVNSYDADGYSIPYNCHNAWMAIIDTKRQKSGTFVGAIINTHNEDNYYGLFKVEFDKPNVAVCIMYLDNDNNNITQEYSNNKPLILDPVSNGFSFVKRINNSKVKTFQIPKDIKKVFIGAMCVDEYGPTADYMTIYSHEKCNVDILTQKNSGISEERPSFRNAGNAFYDTTLDKPIYWTGTKWVDAIGATV